MDELQLGNMAAKRLMLYEVLTALEDDTDFQGADVFMTGPDDATKSDEDSGDEDTGANFINLTGNLLRGEATVTVRTTTGQDNRLEQDSERNDSTDEIADDTNEDIHMDTNEEWNDNITVFMGTNCHKLMPTNRVQRWSKKQRRVIDVQQPQVIAAYNRYMGGVDRMDQSVITYILGVRIKKWWWTLFAFIPDMVVQNAWILYRLTNKYTRHPIDLLEFRRQICGVYLMRYSHRETRGCPCSRVLHIDRRDRQFGMMDTTTSWRGTRRGDVPTVGANQQGSAANVTLDFMTDALPHFIVDRSSF